jgi:hypothetical protein
MKALKLIAGVILAGSIAAAPGVLLAAGPNGNGGGQMAQSGTTQQTAVQQRTQARIHDPAATPAGDQLQVREQARAQDRAATRAAKKSQQRNRSHRGQ